MASPSISAKEQWQFPVSERYLFAVVLVLLSFLLLFSNVTQRLDYLLYDTFLRLQPISTSTSSVIIAIDEKSLNQLGRWPWDRAIHAELTGKLKAAGATAIVFDILFTEEDRPTSDTFLQQSMQEAGNVFLPLHIDYRSTSGSMTEILPIAAYVRSAAGLGHAHFELDEDGIARGMYLYQGLGDSHWPSLALAAFQFIRPNVPPMRAGGNATHPAQALLNVREAYRLIPFVGPPGSLATLSYVDILTTELPADYFSGRVVFVGATAAGLGDFIATPVSGESVNMPGVEVHANVYEALTQNRLGILVAQHWQYLLTLSLVLAIAMIFSRVSPDKNLPLTIALALAVCGFSYGLLHMGHQWFPPSPLLVTLLFAYPFWSWRRLHLLNKFLNQELTRLADEPKLRQVSSYESPQQWAQQVVRLLKPSTWEFRDYRPTAEVKKEIQVTLEEEQNVAEVLLPVNAPDKNVALFMHFDGSPHQLREIITYIKEIFPEFHAELAPPQYSGELMDRRIMQVRQAIATMQDMRQFISDTVANMPEGVLVGDEFGRIMFLNDPARTWLQEDARPGSYIAECMPVSSRISSNRWETLLREVLLTGTPQAEELYLDQRAVLISLVPILFSHRATNGIVITFADITIIHEAQLKRLETINFISHDLRAPLASQLALLDTLKTRLPEGFDTMLESAQALTEKSLSMSDQFLQLARVEAADHIHLYECELLDIVDNAVDSIAPLAQKQLVNIQTLGDFDTLPIVGNPELLERAVVNLLQNAIKFSPPHADITLHLESQADIAACSIQDQGPGIAPHEIPHLFEPYRRTDASERQGIAGSGLGLRFVKLVMDRHGGEIEVSSKIGQGTRITLRFPAHQDLIEEQ